MKIENILHLAVNDISEELGDLKEIFKWFESGERTTESIQYVILGFATLLPGDLAMAKPIYMKVSGHLLVSYVTSALMVMR